MKNLSKKGFTLVELIVVITILAILGTIAFLNFGQYTDDAKDSKVTSDIGQIQQAIQVGFAAGELKWDKIVTDVADFKVDDTADTVNSGTVLNDAKVTYHAGTVNYTGIWIKESDFKFKDSDGNEQPYAAAFVFVKGENNNRPYSASEIAGNIFDKAGNAKVVLKGDYAKKATWDTESLLSDSTADKTAVTNWSTAKMY